MQQCYFFCCFFSYLLSYLSFLSSHHLIKEKTNLLETRRNTGIYNSLLPHHSTPVIRRTLIIWWIRNCFQSYWIRSMGIWLWSQTSHHCQDISICFVFEPFVTLHFLWTFLIGLHSPSLKCICHFVSLSLPLFPLIIYDPQSQPVRQDKTNHIGAVITRS